jgi:hypothetical protein
MKRMREKYLRDCYFYHSHVLIYSSGGKREGIENVDGGHITQGARNKTCSGRLKEKCSQNE